MTYLDGGFGTMIQAAGLPAGADPTDWNLERPDAVTSVHRAYVDAGSDIVLTNTFGATRLKYHGTHDLGELVAAAVANARASGARRVALDIGPTGRLLQPAGDLAFEEAYEAFAELVRRGKGADLVFVETMGDVRELKAAVLAAKENCDLPVYASVALGEDGKLLTGGSVACVATLLESLGVDAYGFNCGLGPDLMLPYVERLARLSTKPIIVKPNAGMPKLVDGKTVFSVGPEAFADHVAKLVAAGASVVGGCCGTTPDHIRAVCASQGGRGDLAASESEGPKGFAFRDDAAGSPRLPCAAGAPRLPCPHTCVSSGTTVVELRPHGGTVIGERINPTGKKLLKEAYAKGDTAYVLREAVKQMDAGAEILDVNCGVPGLDEAALLESTVETVQSVASCPIQIDTADPEALARALRRVNGKPLVNSVNGKRASMDAVFPLVKRYGGVIVALCLDESGIPSTAEGRLAIARRILDEGAKYGFTPADFVFDALTLSVSADPLAAVVTLETVRRLTDELHVNTVLGVSNVSFGLPDRPALNNAMYTLAKRAGLSAAIANPSVLRESDDEAAFDVLLGRDPNCARWIAARTGNGGPAVVRSTDAPSLSQLIAHGLKDDARSAAEALLSDGKTAMDVIQSAVVPALEEVGRGFEAGKVFLPQLLMAADAAGAAFEVLKKSLARAEEGADEDSRATGRLAVVLATVKGDIHDIGKNIVRALLENYGFDVVDLGRDVPPEKIVEAAERTGAALVGLSALMTTTVGAMAETIRLLKARGLACRTVVGGAVVTAEYAASIGADFYAKDAMRTVRIAGLVEIVEKALSAPKALNVEELTRLVGLTDPDGQRYVREAAYRLKCRHCGKVVSLRGLVELGNVCAKDCYYCGIRKSNDRIERYRLSADDVVRLAETSRDLDFASLVLQGGEIESAAQTEFVAECLTRLAPLGLGVTLSLGEQSEETYRRWKDCGAARYLLRIETSNPELYAKLHPADHSWTRRVECLKALRRCGYQVGTGVMSGLPGQTDEDLARDIVFFGELDVDMIGMGPYIPHPDTPLATAGDDRSNEERLRLALNMIAATRLYLHDVNIAATTALQALAEDGRERGVLVGANVMMPNLTDTEYRARYQLYAGKPTGDESASEAVAELGRRLAAVGEQVNFGRRGDSVHFARRTGLL